MPEAIRIAVESVGAHPQHHARARARARTRGGGLRAAGAVVLSALLPCGRAGAETASARYEFPTFDAYISALPLLDRDEIAALALTLGVLCFAVVTAILFVRTRRRLAEVEAAARDEAVASKAAVDRAYALFLSEPQILVAWHAAADEPEIIGDPTLVSPADASVLAFGSWLEADAARDMQHAVDALRARGVGFAMTVTTLAGRVLEAKGLVIGGRAILRLREVSGIKYELAELARRHQKHVEDAAAMRALIAAVPSPIWARDEAGKLAFVNHAYARAVEAKDAAEAVERGTELFEHGGRSELLRAHEPVGVDVVDEQFLAHPSDLADGRRRDQAPRGNQIIGPDQVAVCGARQIRETRAAELHEEEPLARELLHVARSHGGDLVRRSSRVSIALGQLGDHVWRRQAVLVEDEDKGTVLLERRRDTAVMTCGDPDVGLQVDRARRRKAREGFVERGPHLGARAVIDDHGARDLRSDPLDKCFERRHIRLVRQHDGADVGRHLSCAIVSRHSSR